jgi:transketolase
LRRGLDARRREGACDPDPFRLGTVWADGESLFDAASPRGSLRNRRVDPTRVPSRSRSGIVARFSILDGGAMTPELTPALRERITNTIRFLAVDAVERARSGHPGTPMALAAPAFALWDRHLRFDPTDPSWPLRDRFVLSAGHASMLLYALLHLYGFDLSLDEIVNFRQLDSQTPGHPERGHTAGVETTTGPLGQGFANGVGMALAARLARSRFGRDGAGPGHHCVYGIVSDGDLMEGISAEAASLAGHWGLGNLVYLYDDNRITIDGSTALSFSEDVSRRFEAQGWHVQQLEDGQDSEALDDALAKARAEEERPSLIRLRTVIGMGSPNKAGTSKAHGAPLGPEETKLTKEALGWPLEPTFWIPDDVQRYFAARKERKRAERQAADARLEPWRSAHPELAAAWEACRERRVPSGLAATLAEDLEGKDAATRKHSSQILQRLAAAMPFLVGGSADLAESNLTRIQDGGEVGPAAAGPDRFAGRNIHYGIREHGMGAITNGVALDGTFLPYCATFLVFSDYLRPSIRLAALMGARSSFVFTHDSIFLGEDGPTHQPIEHLDALRAIPGLTVFRPADGLETAMAWAWVAGQARGPVALILTRQTVAALRREAPFRLEDVWRGAYTVIEPDSSPDVVLLGSGSEAPLACEAAMRLRAEDVAARVVSVPSLELFAEQPAEYREALVPSQGPLAVAIEAGRGDSYRALVGRDGLIHGIDRFGASAPQAALASAFGFTPERVADRVLERLRGR